MTKTPAGTGEGKKNGFKKIFPNTARFPKTFLLIPCERNF